jgi:hypothetical protein
MVGTRWYFVANGNEGFEMSIVIENNPLMENALLTKVRSLQVGNENAIEIVEEFVPLTELKMETAT